MSITIGYGALQSSHSDIMSKSYSKNTYRLIENVRRRVFLYDQEEPLYRDAEMRTKAWDEIGKDLNISADEAKLAWDKLRRCFSNALNRRRQSTSRARKSWRYHREMEFLEPHVDSKKQPQASVEDFLEVNLHEASISDGEELGFTDFNPVDIKKEPIDQTQEEFAAMVRTSEVQGAHTDKRPLDVMEDRSSKPIRKRSRAYEYVDVDEPDRQYPEHRNAEITMQQPQTSFSPWDMDETDMFFLSMARMTKKLTLLQQAHIKSRLSHEVLQAVIEKEEQTMEAPPKKVPLPKGQKSSQPSSFTYNVRVLE